MPDAPVRRAFLVFHLTLGVVVLILSVMTLRNAMASGLAGPARHLAILAAVEGVAALLFLIPATLQVGGVGLLLTFAVAIVFHAIQGEFPGPLLIYAAGTAFVMTHGSAWGQAREATGASAH